MIAAKRAGRKLLVKLGTSRYCIRGLRRSMAKRSSRIDVLLHQQTQIEQELQSLKTSFCVMRCDVCRSTAYYVTHGDLAGVRLATDFFDITIPAAEKAGGWVIRTIGDEILVHFDQTSEALDASIQILAVLAHFNESRALAHQIHVKITLHFGVGYYLANDIYGDFGDV